MEYDAVCSGMEEPGARVVGTAAVDWRRLLSWTSVSRPHKVYAELHHPGSANATISAFSVGMHPSQVTYWFVLTFATGSWRTWQG